MPLGQLIRCIVERVVKQRAGKRCMQRIGVAVSIQQRYEGRKGKGKMVKNCLTDKADGSALCERSPFTKGYGVAKRKRWKLLNGYKRKDGSIEPGKRKGKPTEMILFSISAGMHIVIRCGQS